MYSFFVLCTLSTALVLVQGQEFNHTEPDGPHEYKHAGNCMKMRKELDFNTKSVSPKALERHVLLKPDPGYQYTPSAVTVRRCVGFCPPRYSPMPVEKAPKSFIVQRHPEGQKPKMQCASVTVMEHVRCKCRCMRNETFCNEREVWIQDDCICQCKDRVNKKRECEKKPTMVWNDDTCACQCRNTILACENGMNWNYKSCECMRI